MRVVVAVLSVLVIVLAVGLDEEPWYIPNAATQVVLRMKLPFDDYPAYSARLETVEGEPVWEQENLKGRLAPNEQRFLIVRVPAKMLQSRTYVISVMGKTAGREEDVVAAHSFSTIRKR